MIFLEKGYKNIGGNKAYVSLLHLFLIQCLLGKIISYLYLFHRKGLENIYTDVLALYHILGYNLVKLFHFCQLVNLSNM